MTEPPRRRSPLLQLRMEGGRRLELLATDQVMYRRNRGGVLWVFVGRFRAGDELPCYRVTGQSSFPRIEAVEWPPGDRDEELDAPRAGGGLLCPVCGQLYYDHPEDGRYLSDVGLPYLTLLCTGEVVKL